MYALSLAVNFVYASETSTPFIEENEAEVALQQALFAECAEARTVASMRTYMDRELHAIEGLHNAILTVFEYEISQAARDVTTFYAPYPEKSGRILWEIDNIREDLTATDVQLLERMDESAEVLDALETLYGHKRIPKKLRLSAADACAHDRLQSYRLIKDATAIIAVRRQKLKSFTNEWLL